jgi:UDP-glucose 4-epimerase
MEGKSGLTGTPEAGAGVPVAPDLAGRPSLVLGATGFIGRRVVRALAAAAADVVAVGRDAAALATLRTEYGVRTQICDLERDEELIELIRGTRPDVTFNLAGYGVARSERAAVVAQRINAEVPGRVAAALAALPKATWKGQRLIHTGSALEYGDVGGCLAEDGPAEPTTLYGRTKLEGTRAVSVVCRRSGLRALTARLFTVYGPGERSERLLPTLIGAAAAGGPVELTAGEPERDFVFVDEVAEGLMRLAASQAVAGEAVNLATGVLTTVRTFTERAATVLGLAPGQLLFGALPTRADEIAHEPVSIARLRALTGWVPSLTIEAGVRHTIHEMQRLAASR